MKFNKQQRIHLVLLGLAMDAPETQALTFYNGLAGDLQNQVLALADAPLADASQNTSNGNSAASHASAAATAPTFDPVAFGDAVNRAVDARFEARDSANSVRDKGIRDIAALTSLGDAWANTAIAAGKTVAQVQTDALAAIAARNTAVAGVASGSVVVGSNLNLDTLGPAISDLFLSRAGVPIFETDRRNELVLDDKGKPKARAAHERAVAMRGLTPIEACRVFLSAHGIEGSAGMSRPQVAMLMFNRKEQARLQNLAGVGSSLMTHSTSDFDHILADTMRKTLRARFLELSPSWNRWARQSSTPDFKTISRTQLSGVGTPPRVNEGEEYTYATKSDGKETFVVRKYGHVFKITYEALINDDLDAFSRVPGSHSAACARLEDDLAYGVLTDNGNLQDGNALFDATNHQGNLINPGTAITIANLDIARTVLRKMRGLNTSEMLDIMPAFLVVPVAKEITAQQLISSAVDPTKNNAVPNPFNSNLTVIANPRLDASSTTKWYLLASHLQIDTVEVCFLDGLRQPQLTEEQEFMTDARAYKVSHIVGSAAIDYRGMLLNNGA